MGSPDAEAKKVGFSSSIQHPHRSLAGARNVTVSRTHSTEQLDWWLAAAAAAAAAGETGLEQRLYTTRTGAGHAGEASVGMKYGLISAILHYFQRKSQGLLLSYCIRPTNTTTTLSDRHPDSRGMLGCITSYAYLRLHSGIVTQVETKLNPSRLDSLICTTGR